MKTLFLSFLTAAMIFQMPIADTTTEPETLIQKTFECPALPLDAIITTAEIAGITTVDTTKQKISVEKVRSSTQEDDPLEKQIFDLVYDRSHNPYVAAAFAGNAKYESRLISYRWEGDAYPDENDIYPISQKATNKINDLLDSKEFEQAKKLFVKTNPLQSGSGFGLFMFTCIGIKQMLIDFAISTGRHIDDPIMQTEFVMYYIQQNSNGLWDRLISDTSVKAATERFAGGFEKCAPTEHSYYMRVKYAKEIYELYFEGEK